MMETLVSRIRQWLKPPVFPDDEEKTRTANLLNMILWGVFVVTTLFSILILAVFGIPRDLAETFTFLSGIAVFGLSIWLRFLTFRGHVKAAGLILTAVIWTIITFWIVTEAGGGGDNSFFVYPLIIALAGLLVGGWAAVGFTGACILVQSGLVYAELRGILSYPETELNFFDIVVGATALLLMGLLIRHAVRNTREGFEQASRSGRALEESNQQLQLIRSVLERRNAHMQSTVQHYVDSMAELAQGNLSVRLELDESEQGPNDPLVLLGYRLNKTIASLQHMALQIRDESNSLSASVSAILASTTQQAAGASQQSAAIAQAASTIDEVRSISERTAQQARGIAELSQETAAVSKAGEQAVSDTVLGMEQVQENVGVIAERIHELLEQSQTISQIISTVDEIAAQSNLLALNASVEAARAGEAGKGFAVVAAEVRALSEQSQAATKRIEGILSQIQEGVKAAMSATEAGIAGTNRGMALTGEAGRVIRDLAQNVQASTQAAAQIAAAAEQQTVGMAQMAQAMEYINQVSAQSVQGVRQVEQAAQQLGTLASHLNELVEQYQL